jgi:hypothetical protein
VAVFAADVEGYSRLMGADEVGTLKGLAARRAILDTAIADHRGRIANTAGDSVLAEFGSAVDAVQCAVEAQAALAEANTGLPTDKRINFRIGIHVGDVMVRAGDLFGDGVNIAARLQTLAQPGGVCVSSATYEQVRKIQTLTFVDLGLQRVKNIDEPVKIYAVKFQITKGEVSGNAPALFRSANFLVHARRRPSFALLSLLGLLVLGASVFGAFSERVRTVASQVWLYSSRSNGDHLWSSKPGDWVLFSWEGFEPQVAHFYKADSLQSFGTRAAFTTRFPLKPGSNASLDNGEAYEDSVIAIECERYIWISTERTIYSNAGKALFHFKLDDPRSVDTTAMSSIRPGSIPIIARALLCDDRVKTPIPQLRTLSVCPASAPLRQNQRLEERRISGSS